MSMKTTMTETRFQKKREGQNSEGPSVRRKRVYSVPQISDDVLFNILKRLPAKTLMRFKCVSKSWLSLICDRYFVECYRIHAETRPEASYLLFYCSFHCSSFGRQCRGIFATNLEGEFSSQIPVFYLRYNCRFSNVVNGIVCLSVHNIRQIHVLNLTTRETMAIPMTKGLFSMVSRLYLGFDPLTNEYKLLHLGSGHYGILTLGTNYWRKIDAPEFELLDSPTCIDGMLYWPDHITDMGRRCIQYFNLREEKFHQLFLPKNVKTIMQQQGVEVPSKYAFTGAFGLGLCVLNMWMLNPIDQSWTKHEIEFAKDAPLVIGRTQTGEILLKEGFCGRIRELFFWDLRRRTCRRVEFPWPEVLVTHIVCNHVENILPLRFLGSKH